MAWTPSDSTIVIGPVPRLSLTRLAAAASVWRGRSRVPGLASEPKGFRKIVSPVGGSVIGPEDCAPTRLGRRSDAAMAVTVAALLACSCACPGYDGFRFTFMLLTTRWAKSTADPRGSPVRYSASADRASSTWRTSARASSNEIARRAKFNGCASSKAATAVVETR